MAEMSDGEPDLVSAEELRRLERVRSAPVCLNPSTGRNYAQAVQTEIKKAPSKIQWSKKLELIIVDKPSTVKKGVDIWWGAKVSLTRNLSKDFLKSTPIGSSNISSLVSVISSPAARQKDSSSKSSENNKQCSKQFI